MRSRSLTKGNFDPVECKINIRLLSDATGTTRRRAQNDDHGLSLLMMRALGGRNKKGDERTTATTIVTFCDLRANPDRIFWRDRSKFCLAMKKSIRITSM
jgi:hypothetical protein